MQGSFQIIILKHQTDSDRVFFSLRMASIFQLRFQIRILCSQNKHIFAP